jgi:hypothetical protein
MVLHDLKGIETSPVGTPTTTTVPPLLAMPIA